MAQEETNTNNPWITKKNTKKIQKKYNKKAKKKQEKKKQRKQKKIAKKKQEKLKIIDKRPHFDNIYIDTLLLTYGYIRNENISKIPQEIAQIINLFSSNITSHSMNLIAATHLFASVINDFMNHSDNKCEFVNNSHDELNILSHIFVRGGACRDSLLSRNIKDIDIVVNIHELSQAYLYHLQKYHSNIKNQSKNCKCIFWRHYLNKYKRKKKDKQNKKFPIHHFYGAHPEDIKDKNVIKILEFEQLIVDCNYLLNAKFIAKIIDKNMKFKNKISCINAKVHGGYHWKTDFWNQNYKGFQISKAYFDIVDQLGWHTYGAIQSLEQYRNTMGDTQVDNALAEIDKYYQIVKKNNKKGILIPVYPFQTTLMFYDFTINCMHIDLHSILMNQNNDIDFCWINKIIYKKYNNAIINSYNSIGFNDLKNRKLKAVNLNAITACSGLYYFWRAVKMIEKFIHQIVDKKCKKRWSIDDKYLDKTIECYNLWFNKKFINKKSYRVFITKCFKGLHDSFNGYLRNLNDRLIVFRYIKFESFFIKKMKKYPQLIKYFETHINDDIPQKYRKGIVESFQSFGYPTHVKESHG
eukprot:156054_1